MAVSGAALVGAAAIGAGAGLLGGLFNSSSQSRANAANIKAQERINAANIQAQKDINNQNLDFIRSQTQAQWERDDNAYQRQVADLQAAGLSPLAATGGAPNSQPVDTPNLQAAQQFPAHQIAPQFDMNSFIQSIKTASDMYEKHQENLSKQGYRTSILKNKADELNMEWANIQSMITTREGQLSLDEKRIIQDNDQFIKSYNLSLDQFEHLKAKDINEYELKAFCEGQQQIFQSINEQLPDKDMPHQIFYVHDEASLQRYETAQALQAQRFSKYLKESQNTPGYHADSNASAHSRGGNGSVSGAGLGFGVGANASDSGSEYHAEAKDKNQIFKESYSAWCKAHNYKYPVAVYGKAPSWER